MKSGLWKFSLLELVQIDSMVVVVMNVQFEDSLTEKVNTIQTLCSMKNKSKQARILQIEPWYCITKSTMNSQNYIHALLSETVIYQHLLIFFQKGFHLQPNDPGFVVQKV